MKVTYGPITDKPRTIKFSEIENNVPFHGFSGGEGEYAYIRSGEHLITMTSTGFTIYTNYGPNVEIPNVVYLRNSELILRK